MMIEKFVRNTDTRDEVGFSNRIPEGRSCPIFFFFVKGKKVNMLGFMSPEVSVSLLSSAVM